MTAVTADVIFRTLFSQPSPRPRPMPCSPPLPAISVTSSLMPCCGSIACRCWVGAAAARAAADIRALFAPLVDARISDARGALDQMPAPGDILDALLDARHPHTGAPFARDDLLDQLATIFLAGHETSASALAWASYLVACDPALQDDLAERSRRSVAQRLWRPNTSRPCPCYAICSRKPAALSPVSFLMREVTQDQVMRGKAMRPGDLVVVSPWLIQRNADHWPCPTPSIRALRPTGKRDGRARGLAAVWQGTARVYRPGFAMQEAMVVLATLLRHFRLAPAPAQRPSRSAGSHCAHGGAFRHCSRRATVRSKRNKIDTKSDISGGSRGHGKPLRRGQFHWKGPP
jgi:cytochrome P450